MTPQTLLQILAHPALHAAGALIIAAIVSWLVRAQIRRLGVDTVRLPALRNFQWSGVYSMLTFWLAAIVLVGAVAPLPGVVMALASVLVRLGMALACLLMAAWVADARVVLSEDAPPAQRREAEASRWPLLAAGTAAGVVTLAGGGIMLVTVGLLAVLVAVLYTDTPATRQLVETLQRISAGVELRRRLNSGDRVEVDGVGHVVRGRPGLLTTRLVAADQAPINQANTALLETISAPSELPGPTPED